MLPPLPVTKPSEFWTEATKSVLRAAIEEGLSATQAAVKLSELFHTTVTRSACLAKVYRMLHTGEITTPFNSGGQRLNGTKKLDSPVENTPQPVVYLRLPFPFNDPFMRKPIDPQPIALSKPGTDFPAVSILDIKPNQCHWPVSDDPKLGGEFMLHGAIVKEGENYCDECKKFAFLPSR